jgi:transcriptional/translational regulatory protein YebC/TACO1
VESFDEGHELTTSMEGFAGVRDALTAKFGDPQQGKIIWKPQNTTMVDADTARSILKFMDVLEDHDDIQNIYGNYEFPEGFEG